MVVKPIHSLSRSIGLTPSQMLNSRRNRSVSGRTTKKQEKDAGEEQAKRVGQEFVHGGPFVAVEPGGDEG